MAIPKVAIIGRPNVGKSSILNWLAGKLVSVVDPTAGVTRDRVTYLMCEKERYFELMDTGGVGIVDSDDLSEDIEHQIDTGINEADMLIFVVDGNTGPVPLDEMVAKRIRGMEIPKLLVVNKCDSTKTIDEIPAFYKLTNAPVITTSVKANRGRRDLLNEIVKLLPEADNLEIAEGDEQAANPELKLAIVGRRNVGKSTFINALAKTDRMIVSEVAGTTRDSVDVRFELDDKAFVAIDTPGVRKKKSLANDIEFYGLVRAQKSIRRADVVMMFFDSQETISKVDKQLIEEINERCKPCIFVVNKWDKAMEAGMTIEKWGDYLVETFASMRHAPIALITAKEDKNTQKLINLAQTIFKQACIRVSTGRLNKVVRAAIKHNPPAVRKNTRPKIYYATQVSTCPPTIILKCNQPKLLDESWKRYLLGVMREALPFKEVPIKVYFRARPRDEDNKGDRSLEDFEPEEIETEEVED